MSASMSDESYHARRRGRQNLVSWSRPSHRTANQPNQLPPPHVRSNVQERRSYQLKLGHTKAGERTYVCSGSNRVGLTMSELCPLSA